MAYSIVDFAPLLALGSTPSAGGGGAERADGAMSSGELTTGVSCMNLNLCKCCMV